MSRTENVSEKKWFTNDQVIKFIFGTFIAAGFWYRMEYKFNEAQTIILKKIDEHILADGFEKQMIHAELDQLKRQYAEILEIAKSEFVRPDEVRMQTRKRNR